MNFTRQLLLGTLFSVVCAVVAVADVGHDVARRLRDAAIILPLERFIEDAMTRWPGRVLEIELERDGAKYIYDLDLVDQHGKVRELEYDAATGELLEEELDD